MTAEPSSGVDLALREIPATAVARSFRSRLPGLRPNDLQLKVETAAEILDKDRQHLDFLHRYGRARVLAFYAEELMPAAGRLTAENERWQVWFTLGCRVVAVQAAAGADRELAEQAERLQADLPHARFAGDAPADREARQQIRTFLTGHLAGAAQRLVRAGHEVEALRAYAALDRLGAASPAQRTAHARLRWRLNDRSPEALRVYLRAREGSNGKVQEPLPAQIDRFLEESLAVAEELPRHELEERLFLNQLALCSSRPPHPAWRNAGLAYLRLGQPSRALPYLERAHGLNGSENGAGAFYLGQARFQVEDYPGSTAAFEEAIARNYSKVRIAAWLGLAYARLRQWEKALAVFRQAEAETAEVQAGELYLNWGRASFIMGEVENALLRFEKAAAAEAADPRAGYGLALCRESLGERTAALAELHRVLGRYPDFAPAVHRLGLLLEDQGDFAGALPRFHAAAALSPRDPEYRLSLALALGRTGDGEALAHLATAAEGGAGGPEVLRRLFLFHQRQGDSPQARRWLAALAAAEPPTPAVAALQARDLASQATEAFNARRYQEAAALWEEVAAGRPEEAAVAERFALALAHATAQRLRQGESAGVGEAAERAFQLAPALPDCRWLYAASHLLDGDSSTAIRVLHDLAPEQLARPELASLLAVAAAVAGEETPEAQDGDPSPLLELLRMLAAAAGGRFEEAAQACEAPGSWRELGLPPDSLNALVAEVKLRGTRRKRQQVVRFLEGLEARDGAGSWAFGVALARQILATGQGLARAGEADLAELEVCQETYERLLGASPPETAAAAASSPLRERYARLLLFRACHDTQRGRLPEALGFLEKRAKLPLPVPAKVHDLERILRLRLKRPSHQKAYALLAEDPDSARQIWETLLAKDPGDLQARHHLACLAWSRAYDGVLARRVEDSLPFWREGLEHFRLLYGSEAYWQTLREKGRALGTAAAHPFDEAAFEVWRGEALYQRATTLLHLIFHTLAGGDLAEAKEAGVLRAKKVMDVLRSSNLDAALRQWLAADLADHYLDPDPTRVPDFERSRRRARAVVDVDPDNLKARTFLLRSVTYEVSTRSAEGDRDFAAMAKLLTAEERHAEWLEEHRRDLPPESQGRTTSDLAAFYDQFGAILHQEGQAATGRFNNRKPGPSHEARRLLEAIQQSYRDSDRRFEKSLALDPVNPQAKERLEHHRGQYPELTKAIRQIPRSG